MPAPIESRVTNLETLVAGIITQHGDERDRLEARHAAIMDEFGNLHAGVSELRSYVDQRITEVQTELAGYRREADARHSAIMAALEELLGRR
ncbi:hypothetical protein SAMN05421776_11782 [Nocardia farcinica]|uniref:Uncharacterized protein n=1 Tax=Nocardia farcinica TaxID=37329 RepID=A0A0H5NX28_NOCFR|nr:hypothetical protein [Nocardia farcinica]AXK86582.1 hypothetical protein DXT66_13945 [Nocardia farcinica]PFW99084.1 hypothetical protein CJ469_05690 [Nocardia farcinica]PFX06122.1 hypothetical protein CJ468_04988 [Nocardia farcinica]CRY79868.1 Uncharacterised protein [Nocardia farcinica]SIT33692.1 hypothetical protein SAMN05421776_11782 [Nocardia farcinica]